MLAPAGSVATLTVRVADAEDAESWNAFVCSHPEATFCHLWEWRTVLSQCFGLAPEYLIALAEDGRVEGVLPLVEMRAGFSRQRISLPYLNYGGALGSARARERLTASALDRAEKAGVSRVEFRSRHSPEAAMGASREKVTVVLSLPDTVDELWTKTFRSKLRSQVRRAQREKMEFRVGPGEEDGFYEVFRRNMRDLGTPVLPRQFFREMARELPDHITFATVRFEGVPVAAGCGFQFNGEFEMSWASSLREYNALAPNMLLYASLMEEMIRSGIQSFNFGRCTPGAGTHRFKLQWGGTDEPLWWTEWPATGVSAASDEPGALLQLASHTWQKLPLPVADRLGPWLVARMPRF